MKDEEPTPHRRADAERNRRRLLEAAAVVFAEHGLDAGVGEIVARAGVGRGTLFRHFPTKQDLIAAIAVDRIEAAIADGRRLLEEADSGDAVFAFMAKLVVRHQSDRALAEAVSEEFLAHPAVRAAEAEFVAMLEELLARGREAGSVRSEVGALDVLMLVKGACAASAALEASPELVERQLALLGAAISAPGHAPPLRGRAPTLADFAPAAARGRTVRPPAVAAAARGSTAAASPPGSAGA